MQNFLKKKHTSFCLYHCHLRIREAILLVNPLNAEKAQTGISSHKSSCLLLGTDNLKHSHQLLLLNFGCHLSKRVNEVWNHTDFYFGFTCKIVDLSWHEVSASRNLPFHTNIGHSFAMWKLALLFGSQPTGLLGNCRTDVSVYKYSASKTIFKAFWWREKYIESHVAVSVTLNRK